MSEEYRILDVNDNRSFKEKIEAINWCTEKNYDNSMVWQPACWPSNRAPNSDFRIWFPRLSPMNNGEYVPVKGCINYLSEDWGYFYFDDLQERPNNSNAENWYMGQSLIIAKDVNGDYVFRGVYKIDVDKSSPNHLALKRIATKVKLIGKPVRTLELLDSVEDTIIDDINTPKKPKDTLMKDDGTIQYICGRCSTLFLRAVRCPECGQLVKEY